MERTFTYKNVTITVRRAKVRDRLNRDIILGKLQREGVGDPLSRYTFATLVSQSTVVGMPWIDAVSTPEEITATFEAWLNLDGALYDLWGGEFEIVNLPMNDPDLIPADRLTDEKKAE